MNTDFSDANLQINIDPTKYLGFTSLVKVVLIALSHPA
jgi:hypothetical protein